MKALDNVTLSFEPWFSPQTPQHVAQQTTQPDHPLPTMAREFTGQRTSVEGQVRIADSFVTDASILTRHASSPSHYEYPQTNRPLSHPSPFHIGPMDPYNTNSAINDLGLCQPILPSSRTAGSSGETRASAGNTRNPSSYRPLRTAVAHSLGHPRQIMPLPSRAASQNFEPAIHAPVQHPDLSLPPDSMTDEELFRIVEGLLANSGSSATPSAPLTLPSSSGVGSSALDIGLNPFSGPLSTGYGQTGYDQYVPFPEVDRSFFPSLLGDLSDSGQYFGGYNTSQQVGSDAGQPHSQPLVVTTPAGTSKRKRAGTSMQEQVKRARKEDASNTIRFNSIHSTAPQVQRNARIISEASTSQDVPTREDSLLYHSGINAGTTTPAEEETREKGGKRKRRSRGGSEGKPHVCSIKTFNRKKDYYRHICTCARHEVERSTPGWMERYGIPEDFKDLLVRCHVVGCSYYGHEMRRDVLKSHLETQHDIYLPEKKRGRPQGTGVSAKKRQEKK